MQIGRYKISLADTKKPKLDEEIGSATAGNLPSLFDGEVIATDKVKIKDLIQMRQQDGTASALYNVLTLPIASNPWGIEPEDDTPEAQAQADFVKEALSLPPHKGGMSTPFELVIADMLRAVLEGYRVFEKVYTVNREGKIVYKKLASRDTETVRVMQDERGGFDGIKQDAFIGAEYKYGIRIPREKCFLFTFGKEKNWLKGESAFRAAYYHYDKKHRLYYLANQAVQQFAIPPKVGIAPEKANQTVIDQGSEALSELATNSSIGLPHGWDVTTLGAQGSIDPMKIADHHNAEMARSILAQFIMLGTGSSTGSWALSNDQSDLFLIAERGLMRTIEGHITSYLLPDLLEFNFANPKYPKFRFANLTDATAQMLKEAFTKIVEKKPEAIPEYLAKGIVEKIANHLEIDIVKDKKSKESGNKDELPADQQDAVDTATAEIQKTALNGAQITSLVDIVKQVVGGQIPYDTAVQTIKSGFPALTDADIDKILKPTKGFTPKPEMSEKGKSGKRRFLADGQWRRDLTPAEQKVAFSTIQKKMDTFEEQFITEATELLNKAKDDAVKRIKTILDNKAYDELDTFELAFGDEYAKIITDKMLECALFAKNNAADEIKVKAPPTKAETKTLISDEAKSVVEKQFNDLMFQIKNIVQQARRKNQLTRKRVEFSIDDVIGAIETAFASFIDDKLGYTAAVSIASAINTGRDDVFQTYKTQIKLYQYSAILDERTCPICEELDSTVVDEAEYESTDWLPPIHGGCRCIWVAILSDEEDPPEATGFPDEPGGVAQPLLAEMKAMKKDLKLVKQQNVVLTEAMAEYISEGIVNGEKDD